MQIEKKCDFNQAPNMPFNNKTKTIDNRSYWNPRETTDYNLMMLGFNMHNLDPLVDGGFIDHFDDAGDTSTEQANPRPRNGR